jgi:amino acid adenylation domain-containing protein
VDGKHVECLHDIIAGQARRAPRRIAVTVGDVNLTYGDLDRRADRVAARLRALGVGPDTLVGLCVDRSADLVVGLLGILKAGGAYVPLDPAYPPHRITFLLEDSGVAAVVTVSRVRDRLPAGSPTIVEIDRDEDPPPFRAGAEAGPANLAYVIYTSGSTGTPKGVLVEHRNVVRLFEQTRQWFGFDPDDVWAMFHSAGFDFSVWEVFGALLHGGRLVIVPVAAVRLPVRLLALLRDERVTVLNQTPSAFRQLVTAAADGQAADLPLRLVIFGGERLDPNLLRPWLDRYGDRRPRLVNMYGITETTVHVTYRPLGTDDLTGGDVSPIGEPIPDLRVLLLDGQGRPVPDGVPGEIVVTGPGVARGYLNRPELTAERFVRRPDGTVAYRSGDRAVRAGGELVYLGRIDDQLKVRGFRIEPGEIEACLCRHPSVAGAVVVPRDFGGGDVRLVAVVAPVPAVGASGGAAARLTGELGRLAAAELPVHLRPAGYELVKELPMTIQGKVDRAALSNPTVPAITEIVEEVLQRKGIGAHEDVFDLGATSLAYIRIVAAVNERFGTALNGSEVGDSPTIAGLAASVDRSRNSPVPTVA